MPPPSSPSSLHPGPLRILASGTLFYTYTLSLPSHPSPGSNSNVRAHSYIRSRNGSACSVLAVLAQFQPGIANEGPTGGAGMGGGGVEGCWLIASLGGNDEGKEVLRELDRAGISTKYCKIWDGVGVPGAWVLHAGEYCAFILFVWPLYLALALVGRSLVGLGFDTTSPFKTFCDTTWSCLSRLQSFQWEADVKD